MLIPPESLSAEALENILQEFVSRDGTDYGEQELSVSEKVERLRPQIVDGRVLIVFDETTETLNLLPKENYSQG